MSGRVETLTDAIQPGQLHVLHQQDCYLHELSCRRCRKTFRGQTIAPSFPDFERDGVWHKLNRNLQRFAFLIQPLHRVLLDFFEKQAKALDVA